MDTLTREGVEYARSVIADQIHKTPILLSSTLSAETGINLLFKCENLQKTGSFKFRGATYNCSMLTKEELSAGVCAHSSGNHASALARAAQLRLAKCNIVMPENSNRQKVRAATAYGASITFCEPTARAREVLLEKIQKETKATFIHPNDAPRTILGQGTCYLEIEEQVRELGLDKLDAIVVPVGGGGLLSGICLAAAGKGVRIVAAEPAGADDFARGFRDGQRVTEFTPNTVCDGLLTPVGVNNYPILMQHVDRVITVTDEEVIDAQRLIFERLKQVVEPSCATTLAAVRSAAWKELGITGNVALVITGGNVDLESPLPWLKSS